jgi:Protein of unknown function (DUF1997)
LPNEFGTDDISKWQQFTILDMIAPDYFRFKLMSFTFALSILVTILLPMGVDSISTRKPTNGKFDTIVSVKSKNAVTGIYKADDPSLSLTNYMKLPVEQYAVIKLPLGATLSKTKDSDEFKLEVPNVKFFHLECKPTVYCVVSKSTANNMVTITSQKCILGGSPIVDSLNSHYKFNVITQFTWADMKFDKSIISNSKILVYVDPPLIFKAFPKSLLESTGNFVMQVALNGVERMFIKALSEDYEKWATNKSYRDMRAALSASSLKD